MASLTLVNNLESIVVDNPLTATATTLNVNPGDGVNFPSTFPYRLTIWDDGTYPDPSDDPNAEIVEVINRSVDALTITRGHEDTTGVVHASSSRVAMLITAGMFNDAVYGITTKLDTIEPNADVTANNPPQVHAVSHTDGTDDIQDATPTQKGLATSTQITKLDNIEAGAEANNISDPDAIDLTDGGETSLHTHAGGGGAVDSVFGRTGVVTAAQDDYNHSQNAGIGANDHHNESHTIVSHDTTGTGANLTALTDGSNADSLHSHSGSGAGDMTMAVYDTNGDGIVDNSEALQDGVGTKTYSDISTEINNDISTHAADSDAHHTEIHTIASHDTVVTGAQLNIDHNKLSTIDTGADVTGNNPPQVHAASHVDGTDNIQNATNAVNGLATSAHISAIEANTAKSVLTDSAWNSKGDFIIAIGNDIANVLPVGSNGQILLADSAEVTGIKWGNLGGGGDMLKSIYDTDDNGIVDLTLEQARLQGNILTGPIVFNPTSDMTIIDISGNNNDLTWMLGESTDAFGFYLKYHGTGSGDANYLTINTENGAGSDFWHMRYHQTTHVIDCDSDIIMENDHTVDGRDVSVDGIKLDTIETNAEVNNISDVNAASLTDGSETSLHTHAGGGGAVDSVFGRTGVVTAATNDYAHNQLSGVGVNDHHNESHTIASHDTTVTGAQLDADHTKLSGIDTGADVTGNNPPQAHDASHANEGSDELNVTGLSGLLADSQTPLTHDLNSHGSCTLAELSTDISDATFASTAGTETLTNKIIELDDALGTNLTYEGLTTDDTVGEAVVFGNLLYMKSDGKWWKTSSAVASGAEFPVTAMAVATISPDASGKLLLSGTVRNDAWNFTTLGKVYCGVDVPTHTQPTTSGHTVQIVGISLDADRMYFNPDNTYVELA